MKNSKRTWPIVGLTMTVGLALLAVACAEPAAKNDTTSERPDAWVTTKVTAKLAADPEINPFGIQVDTKAGVVSLAGKVSSVADREEAEKLARATEGVRDVINNLEIDAGEQAENRQSSAAEDALITAAVKTKLLAESDLSGLAIDVDTAGAVVSLTGTLDTEAQCERAEALARETSGVVEVINNLKSS